MQQAFLLQVTYLDYAEPGLAAARFTGAINSCLDVADFAERLAELEAAQWAVARAAAAAQALTESWGYAEASSLPGCKATGPCCEALPSLEEFAERMSELAERVQQVTDPYSLSLAYATPGRPAGRPAAIDSDLSLADFSERLAELAGRPAAVAAFEEALAYAAPGRPAGRPTYAPPQPLTLADFSERLAELATASPSPAAATYAAAMSYAAPGRPAGRPAAIDSDLSLADFSERLTELAAASPAPAAATYIAAMAYAAAGRPTGRPASIDSELSLADFSERLAELVVPMPMSFTPYEEYAEPGLPLRRKDSFGITRVASAFSLERAQFARERMRELVAREVAAGRLHELAAWGYAVEGLSETKDDSGKHLAACWREGFAFNWVELESMNERLYELVAAAAV